MCRIAGVADATRRRVSDDHINESAVSQSREQQPGQESGYSEPHLSFTVLLGGARSVAH
jgi:hypothetical protein